MRVLLLGIWLLLSSSGSLLAQENVRVWTGATLLPIHQPPIENGVLVVPDIWLNNPRRPMEASGTSGQKVAIHGGLNLSILDGWWPEGYAENNGWAIGHDASADIKDALIQDPEDAYFLYDTLTQDVIPTFYNRDEHGIPTLWVEKMRNAVKSLVYQFSAERQVRDYIETIYKA